jgi:hypothetical protein
VWAYAEGDWRPGVVERASDKAALVTYRRSANWGTGVETVPAVKLMSRTDEDLVDRPHPRPGALPARQRTPDHDQGADVQRPAAGCSR